MHRTGPARLRSITLESPCDRPSTAATPGDWLKLQTEVSLRGQQLRARALASCGPGSPLAGLTFGHVTFLNISPLIVTFLKECWKNKYYLEKMHGTAGVAFIFTSSCIFLD